MHGRERRQCRCCAAVATRVVVVATTYTSCCYGDDLHELLLWRLPTRVVVVATTYLPHQPRGQRCCSCCCASCCCSLHVARECTSVRVIVVATTKASGDSEARNTRDMCAYRRHASPPPTCHIRKVPDLARAGDLSANSIGYRRINRRTGLRRRRRHEWSNWRVVARVNATWTAHLPY